MNFKEMSEDIVKVAEGYMSCMAFCIKWDCPASYMNLYKIIEDMSYEVLNSPLSQNDFWKKYYKNFSCQ